MKRSTLKAQVEVESQCAGITYDAHTLMFCPEERRKMAPSRIINDGMHSYLVNGVASWEVALFLEAIYAHTAVTLPILADAVVSGLWKSSKMTGRSPTYLRNLFHPRMFTDGLYKGQAHQTRAILPLLRYYVETVLAPSGQIPEKFLRSFRALHDIVYLITQMQCGLAKVNEKMMQNLQRMQKCHQEFYGAAYDSPHRPKHHHRFHLPSQWLKCGMVVTCDPLESKHRLYKSGVGDRQRSTVQDGEAFSYAVHRRLLSAHLATLLKTGLPYWQLLPPSADADLDAKLQLATMDLQTSTSALVFSYVCVKGVRFCWVL